MTIINRKTIFKFIYRLMGNNLIQTDTVKYLGITFTSSLKWNTHIDKTCTKAFRMLGFLRRKLTAVPSYVKLPCQRKKIHSEDGFVVKFEPYFGCARAYT